jgi:hypothetical protein
MPLTSIYGHWAIPTTTQTGAYTVQTRDFGSCIQASAAATYTLPAPGPHIAGCWVKFFSTGAGDMVITAPAGTIVTDGDAAANSITYGTNGEEIGASTTMLCDGTSWLDINDLSGVTSSRTIAT